MSGPGRRTRPRLSTGSCPAARVRCSTWGAGTGQLTRSLVVRGLEVTAVEPSEGMRAGFAQAVPGVRILAGTAEDIPLPDASVDLVLCAQAWHWVDTATGVPEVARVLRPGGGLGLLWNVRDEREGWVAELGALLATKTDQDMRSEEPRVGPPFGPVRRHDVAWRHALTPGDLLDLVASRSYVILLPEGERATLLTAVSHLVRTHPSLAGRSMLELPYVTRCSATVLAA